MNSKYHSCQYKLNMQKGFIFSQIIYLSQLMVWLHNCFIQQNGDRAGKDYGRVRFQCQAAASHESLIPLLQASLCPTHFQCSTVVCPLTLPISYLVGPNCDLLRDTSRKWGQRAKERPQYYFLNRRILAGEILIATRTTMLKYIHLVQQPAPQYSQIHC